VRCTEEKKTFWVEGIRTGNGGEQSSHQLGNTPTSSQTEQEKFKLKCCYGGEGRIGMENGGWRKRFNRWVIGKYEKTEKFSIAMKKCRPGNRWSIGLGLWHGGSLEGKEKGDLWR